RLAPDDSKVQLQLAHLADQMGASDRAAEAYNMALKQGGGDAQSRQQLADVYHRRGDLPQPATVLRDAINVYPRESALHVDLAEVPYQEGKLDPAVAELKIAFKAGPPQPAAAKAHYVMAFVLYRRGKAEQAIKEFQQAAQIKPDYAEAYYHIG